MKANGLALDEYSRRWKELRFSLIKPAGDYFRARTEVESVAHVPPLEREDLLRNIYSRSRNLGDEIREALGRSLLLSEIIDILTHSGISCFSGSWKKESAALTRYLYRGECPGIPEQFCCDYWREAARGLVEGLNPEIAYSRHRSLGHGNSGCLDYVFLSPGVNRKLGLVPTEIRAFLAPLQNSFARQKISITLEGLCEDTLYLTVDRQSHPLDKEERALITETILSRAHQRFPQLKLSNRKQSGYFDGKFND